MAQDLSQRDAANEPQDQVVNQTASTNLSAGDFEKNLVGLVKNFLTPYSPLVDALTNVRIAYELNMARNIPDWPKENIFCSADAILALFHLLGERGVFGSGLTDTFSALTENQNPTEDSLNQLLFIPSLMCVLLPWFKERCVFKVKKQDFDPELLNTTSNIFAKMPQWAMCFDLSEENLDWDKRRIVGVIFSRYFMAQNPSQPRPEGLLPSIADEEPSILNNLISVMIYEDGSMDLGPFMPLGDLLNINNFLNSMVDNFVGDENMATLQANLPEEDFNNFKAKAKDTAVRTRQLLGYLVYTLQNMDKLKDSNGNPAEIPAHPGVIMTKAGPRFYNADGVKTFYLD